MLSPYDALNTRYTPCAEHRACIQNIDAEIEACDAGRAFSMVCFRKDRKNGGYLIERPVVLSF